LPGLRPIHKYHHAELLVANASSVQEELPPHFDLELAVLLAGFAFEAYNEPVGGLRETDGKGTSTAFMSKFVQEAYGGVLEVNLKRAENLRKADLFGKSDPYCMVTVGDSGYKSKTRLLTLNPSWNEKFRLYVKDPETQTLKFNLFDYDMVGSDDSLGTALTALADVCNSSNRQTLNLPVQDLGGGGGGGGTIICEVKYFPFTKRTAPLARSIADPSSIIGSIGNKMFGALVSKVEAWQAEERRKQWETELWVVKPDSEWSALASQRVLHEVPLPQDFEKVAYVENIDTDTQCCVWRCSERRVLVLAFRGTETVKWKDIVTDAKMMPTGFNEERVKSRDADDEPNVHLGFLTAFDSVRAKLLGLVDQIVDEEEGEEPWQVYVTGHSLGGALATLMAHTLGQSLERGTRNIKVTMYNYGSPRVGNTSFVKQYNQLVPDSFRMVNKFDGVPRVPLLMNYRHVEHAVYLDQDGTIYTNVPVDVADAPGVMEGILRDKDEMRDAMETLAVLQGGDAFGEHMENCYYAALKLCALEGVLEEQ